jgi:hypothetical protein
MTTIYHKETDGYTYGVRKLDGVRLDGYMAEIITPLKRSYGGRFENAGAALSWCRKIVARDRRDPLPPLT